ncbi:type II toxin-antitoxin system PemK/MazF family toxin [Calidifontibacter terrae]
MSFLDRVLRAVRTPRTSRKTPPAAPVERPGYPGDFHGTPQVSYTPNRDGRPDPGEIVWTWVPYEEDYTKGKDRPVLLVGRDGPWLLALPLTSKDHDRDAAQEHGVGRDWVDIGSGSWDTRGRPSEVRINRILRVAPDAVRREGAVLDQSRFEAVVAAMRGDTRQ